MTRAIVLGGVVAAVLVAAVVTSLGDRAPSSPPPSSPRLRTRAAVVAAAAGQLGAGDSTVYWAEVMPGVNAAGLDWCGAFALWALHAAGLALDWTWKLGRGFLMVPRAGFPNGLPMTKHPEPGDVAYFDRNQHHAVVEAVEPGAVHLINGNGEHGRVTRSTVAPEQVTAFFSIAPLLPSEAVSV